MTEIKAEHRDQTQLSRRSFIKTAWKGLGILAFLELIGLGIAYLWPRISPEQKAILKTVFDAGLVEGFAPGSVTGFRRGHFYLVRLNDGGFMALSGKCTHLGCSVAWVQEKDIFLCPCHSSSFDIKGDVISKPASRALDFFPVSIEKGNVKVHMYERTQRRRFSKSQLTYLNA